MIMRCRKSIWLFNKFTMFAGRLRTEACISFARAFLRLLMTYQLQINEWKMLFKSGRDITNIINHAEMLGQGNPCNFFSLLDTVRNQICRQRAATLFPLRKWLYTNRIHSRQHVSTSILKSLWCQINKCDIYYTTLRQPNILSVPCFVRTRVAQETFTSNREIITALFPRIKPLKVSIWNVNFPINYASIVCLSVLIDSESGDMAIVIAYEWMLHSLGLAVKVTHE